jgi:chemosensory pili system protein ChpA (sensor histidine kinase/response regulator)
MQRLLHTLKGGARMAGFSNIGDLSHAIESLIVATTSARIVCDARFFELLQLALDRLHLMQGEAQNGQPVYPASDVIAVLDGTRKGDSRRTTESPSAPRRSNRLAEPAARRSLQDEIDALSPDSVETEPKHSCLEATAPHAKGSKTQGSGTKKVRNNAQSSGNPAQDLVRIRSELMDRLVNDAGEVNIYHDRLGQQISAFGFNLKELDQTVLRLRHQLRNLELETEAQILFRYEKDITKKDEDFDPLELDRYSTIQQLSRALSESVSDLVSIQEILTSLMRDTETLLLQQSRVSTELQESLMRTRMLRFSVLAPRLRRIARQTAKELNKKVELTLGGESNELDRSVLDKIVAPLEHMLRNAISHGIESTEQRQLNKKPAIGMIHIEVSREASEVVIRVQDDGAGIDLERVRDKARSRGFINEDDNLSDHDVMQFILESGFSTADEVTQISGRGVGLDVVNNEIKELRGVLSIQSTLGKGTVFEVRLPFTLAINKALLVQSGDDLYAIQLTSIEGIIRLTSDELKQRYAQSNPIYEYAENAYELKHLGSLLGMTQPAFTDSHTLFPILLVRSGDLRVALQVEGLLGSREVVVKSVGAKIGKVRGISGATILGDGRVILILDIPGLIRMGAGARFTTSAKQHADQSKPLSAAKVMVVDDSITIRKVTSRMLERNSFEVMTAKDGVDAIGQLQEQTPDLFLLDIEMPRMDGFELASHIRNNQRLKQVPIIMITSRTGEKHRQKAMQMGVNRYLGKPYKESELLANIREILDQEGTLPQVTSSL